MRRAGPGRLSSGLGEMAESAALVWIRGPGFGRRAVRAPSAPCSVRDLIHRHCQDQVRFAVPGTKGEVGDGAGLGAERVCLGCVCSLGFLVLKAEGFSVLRCCEPMLRPTFAFVLCLPTEGGKSPLLTGALVQPSVWTSRNHVGVPFLHP